MDDIELRIEDLQESVDLYVDTQEEHHLEYVAWKDKTEDRLVSVESFKYTFESHLDKLSGAMTAFKWMSGVATISLVIFQLIPYLKGL